MQENVRAVLTGSTIDVLSHVAIRARTQKVWSWTFSLAPVCPVQQHAPQGLSLLHTAVQTAQPALRAQLPWLVCNFSIRP